MENRTKVRLPMPKHKKGLTVAFHLDSQYAGFKVAFASTGFELVLGWMLFRVVFVSQDLYETAIASSYIEHKAEVFPQESSDVKENGGILQ